MAGEFMANLRSQAQEMRQEFFGIGRQGVMPRMRERLLEPGAALTQHERRMALNYMEKVVGRDIDRLASAMAKSKNEEIALCQAMDMKNLLRSAESLQPRQILGKLPQLELAPFLEVLGVNGKDAGLADYFQWELVPEERRLELRHTCLTFGEISLTNPDQKIGKFSVGEQMVPMGSLGTAQIPAPILFADYAKLSDSLLVSSLILEASFEGRATGGLFGQFESLFQQAGMDFDSFFQNLVRMVSSGFGYSEDAVRAGIDATSSCSFTLRSTDSHEPPSKENGFRGLALEGKWLFYMPDGKTFGAGILAPDDKIVIITPGETYQYNYKVQ